MDIKIFLKECHFVKGVLNFNEIPKPLGINQTPLSEIAFWGRSNVGKSSLINAVVYRRKLVKVSNTPGRTREINFFNLANAMHIVDLPGYGYARVSKEKKQVWDQVVLDYLNKSANLKMVYLLIDAEVGFKNTDLEIMDYLNYIGRAYSIVFTKTDKTNKEKLKLLANEMEALIPNNPACFSKYIFISVKDKKGLDSLREAILSIIFPSNIH